MKGAARWWVLAGVLGLLGVVLYHPVRHFGFINLDDNLFVEGNPWLAMGLRWESFRWALLANLTTHSSTAEYWSPITLLSRLLDAQLFGMNPGAFHVTSAVLHGLNAGLLAAAAWRLTGAWGRSAAVALLFFVHPLQVEAVCWLSARKDLLSATFFFLTLLAYAHYVRRQTRARYALLLAAFGGCLMAKPMGVTLPLVLLLLDGWPLRRWGARAENVRLLVEKLPLLLLAAGAAGLAVLSQHDWRALEATAQFPLPIRVGNAVLAYATYLRRFFWPSDLAIFYPHPGFSLSWVQVAGSAVLLAGITGAAWRWRRKAPYFLTGWLWFSLVLGPVIGLVQIGGQAMADRYAYPALVGLLFATVWGAGELLSARRAVIAGGMAMAGWAVVCSGQVRTWRDSESVFRQALAVKRDNALAHLNLGCALQDRGDLEGAREHFAKTVAMTPHSALAWNNLAHTELSLGRDQEAARAYEVALQRDPNHRQSLLFLGRLLKKHGRWEAARGRFEHLRKVAPELPQPYLELGEVYVALGLTGEACAAWGRYLELRPEDAAIRQRWEGLPKE